MSTEEIQKFVSTHKLAENKYLKISFKKRDAVYGIFVDCRDAEDLHKKNFWRIVTFTHFKEWEQTKNINLSRIYNGMEFSKLAVQ